jgi:hypothetical protein
MRQIQNFVNPDSPDRAAQLSRQLSKFEDNVEHETDSIRAGFQRNLSPVEAGRSKNGAVLSPGDEGSFDTSAGDVGVALETPNAKLAGRFVAIVKIFAANNLVISAPGNSNINRAASLTVTAVGLTLVYCDGLEYWA